MKGDTIVALQSSVFSYRHWKWYGTIWQVSFESNLRNEVVVIAILQALLIHWNQFSVPNSILMCLGCLFSKLKPSWHTFHPSSHQMIPLSKDSNTILAAGCLGIPSEALSMFNQARASIA